MAENISEECVLEKESSTMMTENEMQEKSWAHETLTDSGDETSEVNLPVALLRLEQCGAKFKAAPKYGFTTNGNCTMVNKCLSVYFSVDTVCTAQEIIAGFDAAGIDIDEIMSV